MTCTEVPLKKMVHMEEACAECTQNCLLMHKKDKNPSPVATTFFKVMFGDDYSKVLFLPPRFASSVQNKAGKATQLEDSSGEKWTVKFTLINGLLALEEGWNAFSTSHGLKAGDFLVFHYIMESHFVVLMYGQSGCPEIRHFGFNRPQMKDTRKKQKLITDNNSKLSNVNTCDHHLSSESERSESEHLETRRSVGIQQKDERIKKKRTVKNTSNRPQMEDTRKKQRLLTDKPSNVNTNDHHLSSYSSESERSESEHLEIRRSVGTQHKDERIKKKGTVVEVSPSVNAKNTSNRLFASSSRPGPSVSGKELVRDENRENMVSKTPPTVKQFCLVDNDIEHIEDEDRRDCLHDLSIPEIILGKSDDRRKKNVAAGGGGNETQFKKSGKTLDTRSEESKENPKKRTIMPSEATCNNSIKKRLRASNLPITQPKMAKKEPAGASETDTPAKLMKVSKKELISNNGSDEFELKDTKKVLLHNSLPEDNDSFIKAEPVDYDEMLPPGPTNSLFSAVMSSYQYLELPEWVRLKKVILLRNGGDLWPVLYQNQLGIKALTQSWELFARERGIQPGDTCEFVLESEPNPDSPCSVFRVHVTAK